MTNEVTQKDVNDAVDRGTNHIKEHLDIKFKAREELDKLVHSNIHKILQNHSIALYGAEKRNGLVGDLNKLKGSSKAFKWIASVGGLGGVVSAMFAYMS